eukprot:TRINITY_DN10640_c0_g1_i3.p1 TRINITY_DN10640_c0_g1~~TRINITY_DN10640_c0_g1_i3.p1  ORF type:complete len:246 (-),score=37.76 TRINITY_DN10640_c0_g1_i3:1098-1835(-)
MAHAQFLAPILANSLLYYAICPVLISALSSTSKSIITKSTAIFILNQICYTVTYRPLLEAVVQLIFLPFQQKEIARIIQEFPMNYLKYSLAWTSPSKSAFNTFAECTFAFNIDVQMYYNYETDYFFDWKTPFIKPLLKEYLEDMSKANPKNLEEVKGSFRSTVIGSLEKEATRIKGEHLRLSQSFGIAVGLANSYKYVSFSILSCCKDNLALIKSKSYPLKRYVASSYGRSLLELFKVNVWVFVV